MCYKKLSGFCRSSITTVGVSASTNEADFKSTTMFQEIKKALDNVGCVF